MSWHFSERAAVCFEKEKIPGTAVVLKHCQVVIRNNNNDAEISQSVILLLFYFCFFLLVTMRIVYIVNLPLVVVLWVPGLGNIQDRDLWQDNEVGARRVMFGLNVPAADGDRGSVSPVNHPCRGDSGTRETNSLMCTNRLIVFIKRHIYGALKLRIDNELRVDTHQPAWPGLWKSLYRPSSFCVDKT